jgi:hypothetical protein
MKLEEQITSLEISKQLKVFGVKQDSLFVYRRNNGMAVYPVVKDDEGRYELVPSGAYTSHDDTISAFTVAELGVMLPYDFDYPNENKCYIRECSQESSKVYICWYRGSDLPMGRASTEANARGKMLLILFDNGYIKSEELGTK